MMKHYCLSREGILEIYIIRSRSPSVQERKVNDKAIERETLVHGMIGEIVLSLLAKGMSLWSHV